MRIILFLQVICLIYLDGCMLNFDEPDKLERLSNNSYQDVSPRIVIDNMGKVAVFWLSLETRNPIIKGRFLFANGWSKEQEFGACVGHWDVAPGPNGGFLLARSHWGNLYVAELMAGESAKESLISSGMISSPSVLATSTRAYVIWPRKISEGSVAIEGAIYRSGSWSSRIPILILEQRVISQFILGTDNELLLVILLEREGGSTIHFVKLSKELQIEAPLTKLWDLSKDYTNLVKGTTALNSSFWLALENGAKGEERIYVSSSIDGVMWSQPEMISTSGDRNLSPAIAANQGVYVIWTGFDRNAEEQYGRLRGRWRQLSVNSWQEIKEIEEAVILGRDVAIAAGQGQLWLTWEWQEEIYVLRLVHRL